jgi:hypothetical protein
VGDFKNAGREWQPQGQPEETRVHDFLDKDLGKRVYHRQYLVLVEAYGVQKLFASR